MHSYRYLKIARFVVLGLSSAAFGQQRNSPSHPSTAEGELTVTTTVVASVGVVIDENGQPRVIVANAPDPADNASSVQVFEQKEKIHHRDAQKPTKN